MGGNCVVIECDSLRERSMLTLALLAATGNFEEIAMHIRATARTGASKSDVMERSSMLRSMLVCRARTMRSKSQNRPMPKWRRHQMTDLGPLVPRNRELHPEPYWPDYKTSIARSPRLPLLSMESSASEETGPTFGHGLIGGARQQLDPELVAGQSRRDWRADPCAWPCSGWVRAASAQYTCRDLAGQCWRPLSP